MIAQRAGGAYEVRVEENVPARMRDGTILRADITRPVTAGSGEQFPVLLTRTPYRKRAHPELAAAGYIVVSQDVRGRYASDGAYEPVHQMCGASVDREDGYDTVLWAAALDGSTGKVGVFGTSYPAWEAWELAIARPAPLAAMYVAGMSVTSTAVEGVPRPGRRLQWFHNTGAPDLRRRLGLPGPQTREEAEQLWRYTRHKWLWFLPWSDLPEHALGPLTPYFKAYYQHPERDTFRFAGQHQEIDVPILHRTGWYDRFVSGIDHFTAMRRHGRTEATRSSQRLIVGPWGHTNALTRKVGQLDFGPAAEMDHDALLLRWFDFWLKGRDTGVLTDPPVRYFVMGRNVWRAASDWPPAGTVAERWYLHSGGRANTAGGDGWLSPALPGSGPGEAAADRYDYDPRDPVPTLWPLSDQDEPLDQRPNDSRADILMYVSEPLAAPLEVAGNPTVTLYATSSAPDTDFIARLADVHPDGFVQPISYGVVRARYRDGFDRPRLLHAGTVERFTIPLHPVAACFLPGHRLRLEVTSSDFPNFDRNHNTGGDDFADPTLVVAHQTVLHSAAYPSCITLPVSRDGE
jgi:putative CocE/NonD family hydrolase